MSSSAQSLAGIRWCLFWVKFIYTSLYFARSGHYKWRILLLTKFLKYASWLRKVIKAIEFITYWSLFQLLCGYYYDQCILILISRCISSTVYHFIFFKFNNIILNMLLTNRIIYYIVKAVLPAIRLCPRASNNCMRTFNYNKIWKINNTSLLIL